MKSRTKFLISCAGMTAAGAVLAMAGFMSGGRIYGIGADLKGFQVYAPALEEKNMETRLDAAEQMQEPLEVFESILVEAEYADIQVEHTNANTYGLAYNLPGNSELYKEVKDGKLVLRMKEKRSSGYSQVRWLWFGFGPDGDTDFSEGGNGSITIQVPEGAILSEAGFYTDSGDIQCEGVQADSLKAVAAYGDIDMSNIRAQEMEIKLESGRLQMERIQGKSCSVADAYGDASFDGMELTGDMHIAMESGNVRFRDTRMHGLELKNAYGSIEGERTICENLQMSLESGDCQFYSLIVADCSIRSEYGDVDLQLARDAADFGYELRTEYGDIKINGTKMGESYVTLEQEKNPFLKIFCESGNIVIEGYGSGQKHTEP